jgi:hypothetical protein
MRKVYTLIKPQPTIQLEESIQIEPNYEFNINNISIDHYIDSPSFKTVTAYTKQHGPIILWEGEAYDVVGQWTDADVQARLLEMFPQ